jgi:hypothetical protein
MGKNKYTTIEVINSNLNKIEVIKLVVSGVTLFFNAQHKLVKLSPKERCFFDYLCECMRPSTNDIVIDSHFKKNFIKHFEVCSGGKLKMTDVNKYASKLYSLNLLLDTPQRAYFIVNPKYVFRGTAAKRKKYVKGLIENRLMEGLSIAGLVNLPKDKFGG